MNQNYLNESERDRRLRLRDEERQRKQMNIPTSAYDNSKQNTNFIDNSTQNQFTSNPSKPQLPKYSPQLLNSPQNKFLPERQNSVNDFNPQKIADIVMEEVTKNDQQNSQINIYKQQKLNYKQNIQYQNDYKQQNKIDYGQHYIEQQQFDNMNNDNHNKNFQMERNESIRKIDNLQFNRQSISNNSPQAGLNQFSINIFDQQREEKQLNKYQLNKKIYAEELNQQIREKEINKKKQNSQKESIEQVVHNDNNNKEKNQKLDQKQKKLIYAQELKAQMDEKAQQKKNQQQKKKEQELLELQTYEEQQRKLQQQKKQSDSQKNNNFPPDKMKHSLIDQQENNQQNYNNYQTYQSQQTTNDLTIEEDHNQISDHYQSSQFIQRNYIQRNESYQSIDHANQSNNQMKNNSNQYNQYQQFQPNNQQQQSFHQHIPQQNYNAINHYQNQYMMSNHHDMGPQMTIQQNMFIQQLQQNQSLQFQQFMQIYQAEMSKIENQNKILLQQVQLERQKSEKNSQQSQIYTQLMGEISRLQNQKFQFGEELRIMKLNPQSNQINTQSNLINNIRNMQNQQTMIQQSIVKNSMWQSVYQDDKDNQEENQLKCESDFICDSDLQNNMKQSFMKDLNIFKQMHKSHFQEELNIKENQAIINNNEEQRIIQKTFQNKNQIQKNNSIRDQFFSEKQLQFNKKLQSKPLDIDDIENEDDFNLELTGNNQFQPIEQNIQSKIQPISNIYINNNDINLIEQSRIQENPYDPPQLNQDLQYENNSELSLTQQSNSLQYLTNQYRKQIFPSEFENQITQEAKEKKWRAMLEIPLHTHEPLEYDPYIPQDLEQKLIETNDYSYLRQKIQYDESSSNESIQEQDSNIQSFLNQSNKFEQTDEIIKQSEQKKVQQLLELADIQSQQLNEMNDVIKIKLKANQQLVENSKINKYSQNLVLKIVYNRNNIQQIRKKKSNSKNQKHQMFLQKCKLHLNNSSNLNQNLSKIQNIRISRQRFQIDQIISQVTLNKKTDFFLQKQYFNINQFPEIIKKYLIQIFINGKTQAQQRSNVYYLQ